MRKLRNSLAAYLRDQGAPQTTRHILAKFDALYEECAELMQSMTGGDLASRLVNSASGLKKQTHIFINQ